MGKPKMTDEERSLSRLILEQVTMLRSHSSRHGGRMGDADGYLLGLAVGATVSSNSPDAGGRLRHIAEIALALNSDKPEEIAEVMIRSMARMLE